MGLIVVDPIDREPIGRPWLTVAPGIAADDRIGLHVAGDKSEYPMKSRSCRNADELSRWRGWLGPGTVAFEAIEQ